MVPCTEECKRAREEEEDDEKRCRVCLEGEEDGPLVQPCACSGSIKWIHEHCLERWRRTSPREDAAYCCGECRDYYRDALSIKLLSARLQAERMNGQDISLTLDTLAQELQVQGMHDEAEPLYREALEMDREMLGSGHPNTLTAINNLGQLLQIKGDLAAAKPLCREALELRRETLGDRHPDTLTSISDLGQLLQDEGDLAAAEPLCREALQVRRETHGSRHLSTLNSINTLGNLLYVKGDLPAAELLFREALQVYRETLGVWHPVTFMLTNHLGQLLLKDKANLAAMTSQHV